jgi:serine/threonine protein kinase
VGLLRQRLDIVHFFQGNGNELHDSSIVSEEKNITPRRDGYNLIVSVRIHGQDFANKIIWTRNQQGQETYNQEINVLKTLREKPHWHVVFLVCHYISPKNESCLILSPLAGGNLNEFLSQAPTPGRKNLVARWFGCLATALSHIHSQKIKHKDIKSMNILIHGDNIIITDLGISRRFDDNSETSGPSPGSFIYMAPEVHRGEQRGRTQDTWALLCCYIEMLAYLKGLTLTEFRQQFKEKGNTFRSFFDNFAQVVEWLSSMRSKAADEYELALMEFILKSFKQEPNKRPYAPALVTGLQNIRTEGIQPYVGECCADLTGSFAYVKVSKETQAISFLTKLETLAKGSLLHFIVSAGQSMLRAQSPSEAAKAALEELLQEGKSKMVDSIRSAERKLLFIVAPVSFW